MLRPSLAPILLLAGAAARAQVAPYTAIASAPPGGQAGNAASGWVLRQYCGTAGCYIVYRGSVPALSPEGRYLVFTSDALDLVAPSPPSGRANVYRKDLETGAIVLVSATAAGTLGNDDAGFAPIGNSDDAALSVSSEGRQVAFTSYATDLAPNDINYDSDVFVRDLATGALKRVSESIGGGGASGESWGPRLSADGRYVAFWSAAPDLIHGDGNAWSDVFVQELASGFTERVSLSTDGVPANAESYCASLSADGRFVAFCSSATNLDGPAPNGKVNVYLHDRVPGTTWRASRTPGGATINRDAFWPRVSSDGRYVAFHSAATNLVQPVDPALQNEVFLFDATAAAVARLTFASTGAPGPATAYAPSLSADGRYVSFHSAANVFVPGDTNSLTDVFVLDRASGAFQRESVSSAGGQAALGGAYGVLSPDARRLAFLSRSGDLVSGDGNFESDAFLRDRGFAGPSQVYCIAAPDSLGCVSLLAGSGTPSASSGAGFTIQATQVRNQRAGLYFYGTSGSTTVPFGAGAMCVRPPRVRTPVQSTGGSLPPQTDCSGALALDFNAFTAASSDPALVAGAEVWVQGWIRDPGSPASTHLTQGLHFQLGP